MKTGLSRHKKRVLNEARNSCHHSNRSFGVGSSISVYDYMEEEIAWIRRGQEPVDLSEFDESGDYTPTQLDAYADAMLRLDSKTKPIGIYPKILFEEHLYNRRRREIFCVQGYPDEALTQSISKDGQMVFFRTHPQGRPVNTKEARASGASYFK